MSQVLIISDTHHLKKDDLAIFFQRFPDCTAIIHCGDIYTNYQSDDFDCFHICKGNNDYGPLPAVLYITIDHIRFVVTHGHLNHYAYSPERLTELLQDYPADVICFGHTHIPYFYQDKNCIIINPGSLALGRTYPRKNTFALFETKNKEVHFYDILTNQEIHMEDM